MIYFEFELNLAIALNIFIFTLHGGLIFPSSINFLFKPRITFKSCFFLVSVYHFVCGSESVNHAAKVSPRLVSGPQNAVSQTDKDFNRKQPYLVFNRLFYSETQLQSTFYFK